MNLTEHFTKEEFDCKCGCGNGDVIISEKLVYELETVRGYYGKSMVITSGIRCLSHNRKIGSRDTSSHISTSNVCDKTFYMTRSITATNLSIVR